MPNSNDHEICCSFCGKPQSVADRLIAGSGVYICDACVRLCMSIIEDEDRLKTGRSDEKEVGILLPKPQEIKKKLDEYVVGQDNAIRFPGSLRTSPSPGTSAARACSKRC